jgi:fibronectin type 3 domain-containing protein
VRSVAQIGADSVESADSRPVAVAPRDTFAPAAPRDVVVVLVPATPDVRAQLELSWGISTETDLAGYIVYRSEADGGQPSGRWARLHRELLLVPAFRDTSVEAGRRYFYRVTAMDRAGNESQPSAAVGESVPSSGPARR